MSVKSQKELIKFAGLGSLIVQKTGYSKEYVSRVLQGKVNQSGQKAQQIIKLAKVLLEAVDSVRIENGEITDGGQKARRILEIAEAIEKGEENYSLKSA